MSSQASFIQDGQQVLASDLNSLASSSFASSGAALAALLGFSDANANDSPLTVTPGTGMTIVVGGIGQKVLVQARLADYIPAQTYAIAAANSTDRVDLVAFRYADVIVSTGGTASFLDAQGNLGPQPTSYVYRGIQSTVVTGVPGAGLPAVPAGFDPLASIAVPAAATSIASAGITLLVPAMTSTASGGLPVYTSAGTPLGVTKHLVTGATSLPLAAGEIATYPVTVTVTLPGGAAFTSVSSYVVMLSVDLTNLDPGLNETIIVPYCQRQSASTFILRASYFTLGYLLNGVPQATPVPGSVVNFYPTTAGTIVIDWVAIGY